MTFAWLAFYDALLAITMISVGIVGAHFYLVEPFMGFQLFALGFLLSIIGSLVGLLAIFLTRKPQLRAGRNRARFATIVCAVIAVPLIAIVLGSSKYPPINDITTDFDNPPEFVYAQQLQHVPNRDMKYDKAKYADRQQAGYGTIGPIKERLDPAAAFAFKIGFGQKSGKKFEAAERVADFVREQGRHFDQRLLAAELFAVVFEFFCLADITQNENRSSTVVILLQPGMAQRNPDGFGWRRRGLR